MSRKERNIREFDKSFEVFLASDKTSDDYLKLFAASLVAYRNDTGVSYDTLKEIMAKRLGEKIYEINAF